MTMESTVLLSWGLRSLSLVSTLLVTWILPQFFLLQDWMNSTREWVSVTLQKCSSFQRENLSISNDDKNMILSSTPVNNVDSRLDDRCERRRPCNCTQFHQLNCQWQFSFLQVNAQCRRFYRYVNRLDHHQRAWGVAQSSCSMRGPPRIHGRVSCQDGSWTHCSRVWLLQWEKKNSTILQTTKKTMNIYHMIIYFFLKCLSSAQILFTILEHLAQILASYRRRSQSRGWDYHRRKAPMSCRWCWWLAHMDLVCCLSCAGSAHWTNASLNTHR